MLSSTQKLKYSSSVSDLELYSAFKAKLCCHRCIILVGNSNVSVAVNFHTVEFISNFIKHECHAIISKRHQHLIIFLLHQSSFDIEKTRMATCTNFAAV